MPRPGFVLLLLGLLCLSPARAEEVSVPVDDNFSLPAQIDRPTTTPRAVVVLIHGSGSHSRHEELAEVTRNQAPNPFFDHLSRSLVQQSWAVLRYDKRSYALRKQDPKGAAALQQLLDDPAEALIGDALSALKVARQAFPGLPVFFLGHSEGTWVGLQAANRDGQVDGVALVSYSGSSLDTLLVEQFVHRPSSLFRQLDKNGDDVLDATELAQDQPLAHSLQKQMPVLDLNQNGSLELNEFQGGNLSNLYLNPLPIGAWRKTEAALPQVSEIVEKADFRLAFFQGEWDNQTPAYYVKALEMCERTKWKKGNKLFAYYPQCGHALDPRHSWLDVVYQIPAEKTLEDLAQKMTRFFLQP